MAAATSAAPMPVNSDGLPDIVTGWEEGGEVRLYLHPGHAKASAAKDEIALDFGQPMTLKDEMKKDIYLDEVRVPIRTGTADGNSVKLQLTQPSTAKTIAHLSGSARDGKPASLIFVANGIAALTFSGVALEDKNAPH